MSGRFDSEPVFNPDRAPVYGARITEGASIEELFEALHNKRKSELRLVMTEGTWINGLAKSIGAYQPQEGEEPDVPTD